MSSPRSRKSGWLTSTKGALLRFGGQLLTLAVLFGAPLGLLYYSYSQSSNSPQQEASTGDRSAPAVRVVAATRETLVRSIELTGPARSWWDLEAASQIAAPIVKVLADVGDRVPEGSSLAELDVALIRARIREAEAEATAARRELERAKGLLEDGAGSPRRVEEAVARESQAQARLAVLQLELDRHTIRVPGSDPNRHWIVVDRRVAAWDFVQENEILFELSDIETIRVFVNLPERDAHWLTEQVPVQQNSGVILAGLETPPPARPHKQVAVRFDSLPDEQFEGTIARVWPRGKEGTYTVPIEIHVPNPGLRIRPGSLARVRLELQRRTDAVVVPVEAVFDQRSDSANLVVINSQGLAEHRRVRLGLKSGRRIEVLDGVEAGERVVIVGAGGVKDGQQVRILDSRGAEQEAAP